MLKPVTLEGDSLDYRRPVCREEERLVFQTQTYTFMFLLHLLNLFASIK